MDIPAIIDLVLRIGSLCFTVILAILAIKRKVVTIKSDSNEDTSNKILELFNFISEEVLNVEDVYSNLFKEGAKAGSFKLRDVLNDTKEYCLNKGLTYDKECVTSYVNMLVDVMNSNKKFQSTENTSEDKNFKFIGVKENES